MVTYSFVLMGIYILLLALAVVGTLYAVSYLLKARKEKKGREEARKMAPWLNLRIEAEEFKVVKGVFGQEADERKPLWVSALVGVGSFVLVAGGLCLVVLLFSSANSGIHAISANAAYIAGEGCTLNYEDGGDAILVRDLSDSKEFEKKISEVEVSRDLTQMKLELEACQRFDVMWRESPPSNEKTTHSHLVTQFGEVIGAHDSVLCAEEDGFLCKMVDHACDGHYIFVTVH